MRIAIAADHNGVAIKAQLIDWLTAEGHQVDDRGVHDAEVVDYPPLCADVGQRVVGGHAERGIVIGGTGGGEAIASNKIRGIRAGLCHSAFLAEISSAHNNTNVLVLGAKVISPAEAVGITSTWLATPFKGERHQRRLDQIAALERGESLH
jgi:ribose 5-phosphate isomerase B